MKKLLCQYKKVCESDLNAICVEINDYIERPAVILLSGPVGAGKTTLTKSYLQSINHPYTTSSPSYSLAIELDDILHVDLYRLESSEELVHLELPLLMLDKSLAFFEWADDHLSFLQDELDHDLNFYQISIAAEEGNKDLRHITFSSLG